MRVRSVSFASCVTFLKVDDILSCPFFLIFFSYYYIQRAAEGQNGTQGTTCEKNSPASRMHHAGLQMVLAHLLLSCLGESGPSDPNYFFYEDFLNGNGNGESMCNKQLYASTSNQITNAYTLSAHYSTLNNSLLSSNTVLITQWRTFCLLSP